ncbi:YARHG domain-containing protein [Taibaiella koreensis]|uniref:YARHG domain-containing protein n=1 Tax=Taibaiella koreensis TaxID=1268548 RepID=UPI000E59A74B|nr:YARHG domain-containing protein [Taibaiella koreensis]
MTKKTTCLICFSLCIAACSTAVKNDSKDPPAELPSAAGPAAPVAKPLERPGNTLLTVGSEADVPGYWVGMFEPETSVGEVTAGEGFYWDYTNKINIVIEKVNKDSVSGHSVVAGNDRPFAGTVRKDSSTYHFVLKEPGDDKYDGVFYCSVVQGDSVLSGTWEAYKKVRIPRRRFRLTKSLFRYDPALMPEYNRYVDWNKKGKRIEYELDEDAREYDYSYFTTTDEVGRYNASVHLLTAKEVANMTKADLFVMRNTIYARHGYSFRNQQLRAYFDRQSWYVPVSTDVKHEFTEIEKKNIELLLRYEKNAREYYDVFGRG